MEGTVLNLSSLTTAKLTKKIAFMYIDGQENNPLFNQYLEEAKRRLKVS